MRTTPTVTALSHCRAISRLLLRDADSHLIQHRQRSRRSRDTLQRSCQVRWSHCAITCPLLRQAQDALSESNGCKSTLDVRSCFWVNVPGRLIVAKATLPRFRARGARQGSLQADFAVVKDPLDGINILSTVAQELLHNLRAASSAYYARSHDGPAPHPTSKFTASDCAWCLEQDGNDMKLLSLHGRTSARRITDA